MRRAEADDIWAGEHQDALERDLIAAGVPVDVVLVDATDLQIVIDSAFGQVVWTYPAGDQWTNRCPIHRNAMSKTDCGDPFTSNSAAIVRAHIVAWWSTHG